MDFLISGSGAFLGQTILHSIIAALIVEAIIRINRNRASVFQVKFRSLSLILPVLFFFGFYISLPFRTSGDLRMQTAIFDSSQWMSLSLIGGLKLWHVAAGIIVVTALFFMSRELVPLIGYGLNRRTALPALEKGRLPKLDSVLAKLAAEKGLPEPVVLLSDEAVPAVYILGRRALVLSMAAIEILDIDELEAVAAHELAHYSREILVFGRICLVFRLLMLYNPVALLVYHRINHDIEKACDDLAVSVTGKPLALASGLLKMLRYTRKETPGDNPSLWRRLVNVDTVESKAHLALVKERVERILKRQTTFVTPYQESRIVVTAGLILALLYFVV